MDKQALHQLMVGASLKKIKSTSEGFACVCPLHNGVNPTFNINSDTGLWRCWNPDCSQKGNLVQFLVRVIHMPYDDAIAFAESVPIVGQVDVAGGGWRLPDYDERWKKEPSKFIEEARLGLYSRCPQYMVGRGFPKAFLREFDIGWDENGYEHPVGSGRIIGKKRVTFAVRDPYGRLLGLTRRTVNDEYPKYLHDFERNKTLYLIHLVKPGSAIGVSEGNPDALMARLLGRDFPGTSVEYEALRNMTATLGGGLTDEQADLVLMYDPKTIVLAFDNDPPGEGATRVSIKKLRERGAGEVLVMRFPSHDLGDLTSDQLVDVDCVSAVKWMIEHPADRATNWPTRKARK